MGCPKPSATAGPARTCLSTLQTRSTRLPGKRSTESAPGRSKADDDAGETLHYSDDDGSVDSGASVISVKRKKDMEGMTFEYFRKAFANDPRSESAPVPVRRGNDATTETRREALERRAAKGTS